jgi:hypothetical protein
MILYDREPTARRTAADNGAFACKHEESSRFGNQAEGVFARSRARPGLSPHPAPWRPFWSDEGRKPRRPSCEPLLVPPTWMCSEARGPLSSLFPVGVIQMLPSIDIARSGG